MEGLTRLVSESLARHGFDRPLDYRRLRWSRWFRCESHHSLLVVPSQPGVFAVAEEIMDFGHKDNHVATAHVATAASAVPRIEASGSVRNHSFQASPEAESATPEAAASRRMLAVTQFFEDEDMAFVLDRMLSVQNPMSARLASGRYFVRFVVIEDPTQRRSICSALNQWMVSAAEKATGIGSHFATSLELTPATEYVPAADSAQQSLFPNKDVVQEEGNVGRTLLSATAETITLQTLVSEAILTASRSATAPQLNSGAATNIHCPTPFPSGF